MLIIHNTMVNFFPANHFVKIHPQLLSKSCPWRQRQN